MNEKRFGCLAGGIFIMSLLILSSAVFARAAVNITVDGKVSDWAEVTVLGSDADDMADNNTDVKAVYAANNNDYLYLRADVYGNIVRSGNYYSIYLDTDQNAGTGFAYGWWTTGADYRIYIDEWTMGLQKFMGSNSSDDTWGWNETVYAVKDINIVFSGSAIECAVPRLDIGETETSSTVNILFRTWPREDFIPCCAALPMRYDFKINIIPQPQQIILKNFGLDIDGGWDISVKTNNEEDLFTAQQLQQELSDKYNLLLQIVDTSTINGAGRIILANPLQDPAIMNLCIERNLVPDEQLGEEGYFLEIFDDEQIIISANTSTGIFYGMQTLRQLFVSVGNFAKVQGIRIKDWPDSRMRGMHFCGVNFSAASSDYVYDKIDKMAKYKMNTAVFGVNYYNLETDFGLRKKLTELFDYCRRCHIEPIPEMSTWSNGCEVTAKDLNTAEGVWIKNEQFIFVDNTAQAVVSKDVMINNAGFEIDANGDGMPDGWNIYGYPNWALIPIGQDIYWRRDSAEKRSGTYSMKLTSGAEGNYTSSVLQSNSISVEPNTLYTLSYFSKKTAGSGSGYNLAMRISQLDQFNKYIVENFCGFGAVGAWGEERINFYTDENCKSIKIWIWLYQNKGTVWIDDLKLERMNGCLRNILTTSQTDIVITNLDKTKTYVKGIDYNLVKGNLKTVYYLLDSSVIPAKIERVPTGAIGENETVLVSCDLFAQFHELSWKRPYCPSDSKTYEIISVAFAGVRNYLNPKYVSIKMDELLGGMNRDSRCLFRNLTNAELFADGINRLYNCIRAVDPDIKIMMWDDMLNPWHFGGRIADQKMCGGKFGTTKEAIDLIPKDIIQMIWWYSSSDYKGKMANSPGYFTEKGFEYLVSPWYDIENIKLWRDVLRKHRNSLGMIDTSWPGTSLKWQGLERTAEYSWRYK